MLSHNDEEFRDSNVSMRGKTVLEMPSDGSGLSDRRITASVGKIA